MFWKNELPSAEGYYWVRPKRNSTEIKPMIVRVCISGYSEPTVLDNGVAFPLNMYNGYIWSEMIREPKSFVPCRK